VPTLRAVACDIDGTITGRDRRISLAAVACIRDLVDHGVEVVLASGNTACFLDALARMVGTQGSIIAENGGAWRIGFTGALQLMGDRAPALAAYHAVEAHFREKGVVLEPYGERYRFTDFAFARTVSPEEVREVVEDRDVRLIDTGFALHLQAKGMNKGLALARLAAGMGIPAAEFLAAGDSENDLEMLGAAGIGVTVQNAGDAVKAVAAYVSEKRDGDGFVDAVTRYRPYFLER
jgi:hypothetical protein